MGTVTAPQKPGQAAAASASRKSCSCSHCGEEADGVIRDQAGHVFCCSGCEIVFDLLHESDLSHFYRLENRPGVRARSDIEDHSFDYLETPDLRQALIEFQDETKSRVSFRIPSIHCLACVWLLENLGRLEKGVLGAQVDFPRRTVSILFNHNEIRLSELVGLLAQIGYEPDLRLEDASSDRSVPSERRQWLKIGVAGFAFGNVMLYSLAGYFGLDSSSEASFAAFFGYLSLLLSVPVLVYCASDYWKQAWNCFQAGSVSIEVPIALGMLALFAWSCFEIVRGGGEGYLDSFTGLVFFLLCGKAFQSKAYRILSFEQDYRSYFPLSADKVGSGGQRVRVPVTSLKVGDHIQVKHGGLIPADARLVKGEGLLDYSFLTGESEPTVAAEGETVYGGGRQQGGEIELMLLKSVSGSYLTSLWDHPALKAKRRARISTLTDRLSGGFTATVIGLALITLIAWWETNPGKAIAAAVGVLIVACPCALALAAPFASGAAVRSFARRGVFLRSGDVVEPLSRIDTIVFDKTGTLTDPGGSSLKFIGQALDQGDRLRVGALCSQSAHPLSAQIAAWSETLGATPKVVHFFEAIGRGLKGTIEGHRVVVGSLDWLKDQGVLVASPMLDTCSVLVAIDGQLRGGFAMEQTLRVGVEAMARELEEYNVIVLTGDSRGRVDCLAPAIGRLEEIQAEQSPHDKIAYIESLKKRGRCVLTIGDGLNDAGALRVSDVGLALAECSGAFSPASDGIIEGRKLATLPELLRVAKGASSLTRVCLGLSLAYNVVGITFAALGQLSPIVCAVLMPLSSVTVVAIAVGGVAFMTRPRPESAVLNLMTKQEVPA